MSPHRLEENRRQRNLKMKPSTGDMNRHSLPQRIHGCGFLRRPCPIERHGRGIFSGEIVSAFPNHKERSAWTPIHFKEKDRWFSGNIRTFYLADSSERPGHALKRVGRGVTLLERAILVAE